MAATSSHLRRVQQRRERSRLASVQSSVSTQLHPATERRLSRNRRAKGRSKGLRRKNSLRKPLKPLSPERRPVLMGAGAESPREEARSPSPQPRWHPRRLSDGSPLRQRPGLTLPLAPAASRRHPQQRSPSPSPSPSPPAPPPPVALGLDGDLGRLKTPALATCGLNSSIGGIGGSGGVLDLLDTHTPRAEPAAVSPRSSARSSARSVGLPPPQLQPQRRRRRRAAAPVERKPDPAEEARRRREAGEEKRRLQAQEAAQRRREAIAERKRERGAQSVDPDRAQVAAARRAQAAPKRQASIDDLRKEKESAMALLRELGLSAPPPEEVDVVEEVVPVEVDPVVEVVEEPPAEVVEEEEVAAAAVQEEEEEEQEEEQEAEEVPDDVISPSAAAALAALRDPGAGADLGAEIARAMAHLAADRLSPAPRASERGSLGQDADAESPLLPAVAAVDAVQPATVHRSVARLQQQPPQRESPSDSSDTFFGAGTPVQESVRVNPWG